MIDEVEWRAKRPSITQIKSGLKKAIASGATRIQLTWGENQITVEKQSRWIGYNGPWTGEGWIGKHGGDNIAQALNEEIRNAHD